MSQESRHPETPILNLMIARRDGLLQEKEAIEKELVELDAMIAIEQAVLKNEAKRKKKIQTPKINTKEEES